MGIDRSGEGLSRLWASRGICLSPVMDAFIELISPVDRRSQSYSLSNCSQTLSLPGPIRASVFERELTQGWSNRQLAGMGDCCIGNRELGLAPGEIERRQDGIVVAHGALQREA
jgi:hypothetical protein